MDNLEALKAVARIHYDNPGSTEAALAAVSESVIYHGPAGQPKTLESWRNRHRKLMDGGLSESHTTIHMQVAEGDLVVTQWTKTAVHAGDFLGMAATGKHITMIGIGIDRVQGGKVVEHWGLQDLLGVVGQVGLTPTPERPREA